MFQIYGPLNVHDLMPTQSPIKPLSVDKIDAAQALLRAQENDHHHAVQEAGHRDVVTQAYRAVEELPGDVPVVVAGQIMSSPLVTVPPDASVADALGVFLAQGFRHAPVALDSGKLVGMVSERDMLRHLARLGKDYEVLDSAPAETLVAQVMTTAVLTATVDTDVRYIARVFVLDRLGAMPIVDASGVAQGMICRSDVLRAVMQHYALELWA